MPKKYNLLDQLTNKPHCMGVAWEVRPGSGLYNFQNDNDLGLDLDGMEGVVVEAKKIPLGNGHYMLLDLGYESGMEDGGAADLDTVKALLKECHPTLFTLDPREADLCQRYWQQF